MPAHRVHAPDIDFSALRTDLKLPAGFAPEVAAEAERAAAAPRLPELNLTDIPMVTVDPPGARDLDQAVHLSKRGTGFLVRYAIADVASFVVPDGALDVETRARGATQYFPDARVPLHPAVLSEGAASLLPGAVRPAVMWTIALDADAEVTDVRVERARVRSTAQLDYGGVQAALDGGRLPAPLAPLAELGRLREARALRLGGIELDLPEQEVQEVDGGGFKLSIRAPFAVEGYNAQISLLTGACAASLMLDGRVGLLRTLPPADPRDVARLRKVAAGLGVDWPERATPGEAVAGVDTSDPRGAAFVDQAAMLLRGAGYTAFDGEVPAQPEHAAVGSPYAHVTAPLRRLADRYAAEVCLALCAGTAVPGWVRAALPELPAAMDASDRRSHEVDRAVIDLTEAILLRGREGEEFDASVVEANGEAGTVVIVDPPIRAKCVGVLRPGERVRVRLTEADPVRRRVRFTTVAAEPADGPVGGPRGEGPAGGAPGGGPAGGAAVVQPPR